MKILSLDLGTKMGYAFYDTALGTVGAGSIDLAKIGGLNKYKKDFDARHFDPRISAMLAVIFWLQGQLGGVDLIAFEDVKFASSQLQTQLWASFRGALWSWVAFLDKPIQVVSLNTSTLKKVASGKGNADKPMMALALKKIFEGAFVGKVLDDNAIDALHLLNWAAGKYAKGGK